LNYNPSQTCQVTSILALEKKSKTVFQVHNVLIVFALQLVLNISKGEWIVTIPIYRPYVFLRCGKCGRKTDHVLINITSISKKGEIEETYECQECGETKKIYELATMTHFPSHIQASTS